MDVWRDFLLGEDSLEKKQPFVACRALIARCKQGKVKRLLLHKVFSHSIPPSPFCYELVVSRHKTSIMEVKKCRSQKNTHNDQNGEVGLQKFC